MLDVVLAFLIIFKAKQKYRGMFETQKSGNKTSLGEIGLDIRTHASPQSGTGPGVRGVSVLCWHAAPVIVHAAPFKTIDTELQVSQASENVWKVL